MIKVENIDVWGFEHAIRGMRNPMNSWNRSDSKFCLGKEFRDCTTDAYKCIRKNDHDFDYDVFCIGKNDLALMRKLFAAGTEHRKYLRQIFVSMDITAPLYWWKEFDTYKIGTTANSCSTMHKVADKEFVLDDFSHDHLTGANLNILKSIIEVLNVDRKYYQLKNDKETWWQMIQLLPSSYNQKRTVTMNYENVFNIIHQRSTHKLDEWCEFCDTLVTLPYIKEIWKG